MKKIRLFICILLISAMMFSGCSNSGLVNTNGSGNSSQLDAGASKDSLVYCISSEVNTLDPPKINSFKAFSIFNQIYDTLIMSNSDGTLAPGLAEKWEISDDGLEVVFYLRKDVKFHNGDIMTADDVVFSINRSIESPQTATISSAMKAAEKIDDYTVKLTLQYPFAAIETCIGHAHMSIVSKKAVEADPEGFERNPVGTGPYKLVDWKAGDKYIFESFNDYWRGEAAIKNLTFKVITDSNTAVIALENGEIDVLDGPPPSERENLLNNDKVQYHETEAAASYYVAFNNESGPFADPKVREAVSYGIDKEAMLIAGADGVGTILDCFPVKSAFGYPNDVKGNEYDLDKAKKLLAEAGYPDGFDCTIIQVEEDKYYKPSEVLQDALLKMGINAKLEIVDLNLLLELEREKREYEITIDGSSAPYSDCNYIYPLFYSDRVDTGENFFGCRNEELDKMLDLGRVSQDKDERLKAYKRACQIINEEAVAIPLYSPMTAVAANKNLKGVQPNSMTRYYVYDYSW